MDEKRISLPGWKIIRVIGKGSSGTVYEIEKEDEFGEGIRSALKVISIPESRAEIEAYRDDGYDDESLTKLFRSRVESITSEFRLMNRLKGCSNIVSYEDHTITQHENDVGYDIMIRMELLTPLPKYFERHAIDEQTVCKLGTDICRALEMCGRSHIIHRDIKPQNIFISENGDYKLGDFGIARTSDHTMRATKIGTYGYMAPEVYWGKPYNASVDLYSLGLVLYWMLNERRGPFLPLLPDVPTAEDVSEALERRMNGEPLPAPKYGSEELKRIVLKACAFDPKDRYQSPGEMKLDLMQTAVRAAGYTSDAEAEDPLLQYELTIDVFGRRRPEPVRQEPPREEPKLVKREPPREEPKLVKREPPREEKPASPAKAEKPAEKPPVKREPPREEPKLVKREPSHTEEKPASPAKAEKPAEKPSVKKPAEPKKETGAGDLWYRPNGF